MRTKLVSFIYCIFSILSFYATTIDAVYGAEIPSCLDITKKMSSRGASEKCAPIIIKNDAAFKALNQPIIKKIGFDWYVFDPQDELKNLSYSQIWEALALIVSAVQSLHEENADIFFAIPPRTKLEETLITLGQYPQERIKAHARYVMQEIRLSEDPERNVFPPGHHERTYVLIVY